MAGLNQTQQREQAFENLLKPSEVEPRIALYPLQRLCAQGIPDTLPSLRARVWSVLCGLCPAHVDKGQWPSELQSRRQLYADIAEDVLKDVATLPLPVDLSQLGTKDRLLVELANDVVRTQAALDTFTHPVIAASSASHRALFYRLDYIHPTLDRTRHSRPALPPLPLSKPGRSSVTSLSSVDPSSPRSTSPSTFESRSSPEDSMSSSNHPSKPDALWEVLLRVLYVYATLNPSVAYVQGMNEIAAPLLYVFAQHEPEYCESDAFWALSALLGAGLSDLFSAVHDGRPDELSPGTGIHAALAQLEAQLAQLDPELASSLLQTDVRPTFYALNWFMSLFAQSFPLPDVIHLWDIFLAEVPSPAESNRLSPLVLLMIDFACAIVLTVRDRILHRSFPVCIGVLQSAPAHLNIDDLLQSALAIKQRRLAQLLDEPSAAASATSQRLQQARRALTNRFWKAPEVKPVESAAGPTWWQQRMVALGESDVSAALSKTATNLSLAALRVRESAREAAPGHMERLRARAEDLRQSAQSAHGNLTALVVRPPSPEYDDPFVPPSVTYDDHPHWTPTRSQVRSPSPRPQTPLQGRPTSPGPRKLLLSGSVRSSTIPLSPETSLFSPRSPSPLSSPLATRLATPSPTKATEGHHNRSSSLFTPEGAAPDGSRSRSSSLAPTLRPPWEPDQVPLTSNRVQGKLTRANRGDSTSVGIDPAVTRQGVSLVDEPASRLPPTRTTSLASPISTPPRKTKIASARRRSSGSTSSLSLTSPRNSVLLEQAMTSPSPVEGLEADYIAFLDNYAQGGANLTAMEA